MWRASASLSFLALAGQLLQLALQFILARSFGTGLEIDALVAALAGPNLLLALLILSAGQLLVPQLLRADEAGDYARTRTTLLAPVALASVVLAAGFIAAPGFVLGIFTPGLEGGAHALARQYLPWAAAAIVPSTFNAYFTHTHNARERYAVSAGVGVIRSALVLGAFLVFKDSHGVYALVVAQFVVGALAAAALGAGELRGGWGRIDWSHPALKKLYVLSIPVVLVAASTRVNIAVDRFFVSFLPEGNLSILHYADRWVSVVQAILSMPLVTVLYTKMSAEAAAQKTAGAASREAFSAVFFIGIPAAAWTWIAAPDLARLLLLDRVRGVDELQTLIHALRAYSFLIAGMAFGSVLVKGFYAQERTLSPMIWAGVVPMIFNVVFDWLLVERFGVAGLAAVTSLNAVLGLPVGAWLFARHNPGLFGRQFWAGLGRALVASLSFLALAWGVSAAFPGEQYASAARRIVALGLAAPMLYLVLARMLGSPEAREILALARSEES